MTERVAEVDAHEGPVYLESERALYFTTRRAGRQVDIMRLSLADGRISIVLADARAARRARSTPSTSCTVGCSRTAGGSRRSSMASPTG